MKMTKLQARAIARIESYFSNFCWEGNHTTVKAAEITDHGSFLAVSLETVRSDCDEYSQRAILCRHSAQFFVSRRGKITVTRSESGLTNDIKSTAKFLHADIL